MPYHPPPPARNPNDGDDEDSTTESETEPDSDPLFPKAPEELSETEPESDPIELMVAAPSTINTTQDLSETEPDSADEVLRLGSDDVVESSVWDEQEEAQLKLPDVDNTLGTVYVNGQDPSLPPEVRDFNSMFETQTPAFDTQWLDQQDQKAAMAARQAELAQEGFESANDDVETQLPSLYGPSRGLNLRFYPIYPTAPYHDDTTIASYTTSALPTRLPPTTIQQPSPIQLGITSRQHAQRISGILEKDIKSLQRVVRRKMALVEKLAVKWSF